MDRVGGPGKPVALTIRLGFTSLDPEQLPAKLGRAKIGAAVGPTVAEMLAVPLTADVR
jgi:hypothetical protein